MTDSKLNLERVIAVPTSFFVRRAKVFTSATNRGLLVYRKVTTFAKRKPFTTFFAALLILFLVIAANVMLSPKVKETKKEQPVKSVGVYRIGQAARMNIMAQVDKSGVVTVVAQTSGVVTSLNAVEGQKVGKGANLVQLSSSYSGGNAAAIQASIAQKQYENIRGTFDAQKEIIGKQREIANNTASNAADLRDITNKSISETQSVVDRNSDILNTLTQNLANLQATNVGGVNDSTILSTKQLQSQLEAGNNQLKQALRNSQYQASSDNPPAHLADLQKDITLKQLDLQEKSLQLNKDVSQLQVAMAAIGASLYHPVAPFAGTIDRVHVHIGDLVNPGMPLITLTGDKESTSAIAKVPGKVAQAITQYEESTIYVGRTSFKAVPTYVSHEATDGQLYTIIFTIPSEYQRVLADGSYIRIEVPVGLPDTSGSMPFVPIDSVYQTQEHAFVYVVASDNTVTSKEINLGEVVGENVEVISGIDRGDQIITNRNVIAGDKVSIAN